MTKEVADWKAGLAAAAGKIASTEKTAGNFLSFRGGHMTYQDNPIPNNTIQCIVVASLVERTMYDRAFDPEDKAPPTCFAYSDDPKNMIAHTNVPTPQAPNCKDCQWAEFGTALQGKGPRCKSYRKLAVMPVVDQPTADDIAMAELASCRVPPTSVVNWSKYASALAAQGLAPWAVKTLLKVAPHPKKQFEVTFEAVGPLGKPDLMATIFGRLPSGESMLVTPYEYEEETKY